MELQEYEAYYFKYPPTQEAIERLGKIVNELSLEGTGSQPILWALLHHAVLLCEDHNDELLKRRIEMTLRNIRRHAAVND